MKLYYHNVGREGAKEDFKKTVFGNVSLSVVKNNVPDGFPYKSEMLDVLKANFPFEKFNCWGVPAGAKVIIKNLQVGDTVLLVETIGKGGLVPALCPVVGFWRDELRDLSKALWNDDKYPYIFFFQTERLNLTWEQLREDLTYSPRYRPPAHFHSVKSENLDKFGGVERYVEYLRINYSDSKDSIETHIARELRGKGEKIEADYVARVVKEAELINNNSLNETPSLTEGAEKKVKTTVERPRSAAFRISIKKLYKSRCAVCELNLMSPDGKVAVDSAHIYPKELDGSDDFRNGICLCRMHHWAFDSGWFSLTDDYTIIVREDLPKSEEYDFIRGFEGKKINLPEQIEFAPHPTFLLEHRKLKGFES